MEKETPATVHQPASLAQEVAAVITNVQSELSALKSESRSTSPKKKKRGVPLDVDDGDAMSSLEKNLTEKLTLLQNHAKAVDEKLAALASQQEDQKATLEKLKGMKNQEVLLDIGGTIFRTTYTTLLSEPDSMFTAMFSGRFPLAKNDSGAYFIDRDPTQFHSVLNFLQNGPDGFVLPDSEDAREELLREADFYRLESLVNLLQGKALRERDLGAENVRIREDENRARQLFLDDPLRAAQQPYMHLLEVYSPEVQKTFRFPENANSESTSLPLILDSKRLLGKGSSIHSSLQEFQSQFDSLAPALKGFDFSNVFVAGGAVVAALIPHSQAEFAGSDVDLFLYGLTKEQALQKILSLETHLRRFSKNLVVIRTSRTLTFVCGYPQRNLQIVLRLYASPAEVLLGFDLDCVAIGYDGKRVWALPRARRALNLRVNIADPSRQTFRTTSYEYRLWKYSKRGFAVAVPGFRRRYVNPDIFQLKYNEISGFARLLFLEMEYNREILQREEKVKKLTSLGLAVGAKYLEDKVAETSRVDVTKLAGAVVDYNNGLLLPYGPNTTPQMVAGRLRNRYSELSSAYLAKCEIYFIYGPNLESVSDADKNTAHLNDEWIEKNADEDEDDEDGEENVRPLIVHVPKHIEFIGSLKEYISSLPRVEEDWYRDAFMPFYSSRDTDAMMLRTRSGSALITNYFSQKNK